MSVDATIQRVADGKPAGLDTGDRAALGQRVLVWAFAALAVALRARVAIVTGAVDPAALMTLRFSENIAAGHGFVYNVGERVLGTTTPLFALIMALGIRLGVSGMVVAKVLGVIADGALCLVVAAWLRSIGLRRAGVVAAALVALNLHLIHWSTCGMETSLVTLGIASALFAFSSRRITLGYAILGVLFLLRWDTVLLTAVLTATTVAEDRRIPLRGLGVFALLVLPWLIFATLYFGNPIPVTMSAKAAVYAHHGPRPRLHHVRAVLGLMVSSPWDAVVTACAAAGIALVAAGRKRPLYPAVIFAAGYWAAYLASRIPAADRYATPALPVHQVLAALALAVPAGWVLDRLGPRAGRAAAGAAAIAATLLTIRPLQAMTWSLRDHQGYEREVREAVGVWLSEHSDPADVVLVTARSSVGTLGYYARRRVIDSKGTVTPETLRFWGPDHVSPDYDIARALSPAWIVLHPGEIAGIERGAEAAGRSFGDDYERARTFPWHKAEDGYEIYRRRRAAPR